MLGEIFNPSLDDLHNRLSKVEQDIEFYTHQHKAKMRQLYIDKKRIELMIEIEHLNNAEHKELTNVKTFD